MVSSIKNKEFFLNFYEQFVKTEQEARGEVRDVAALKIEEFLAEDFKYIKYPFIGIGKVKKNKSEYLKNPIKWEVVNPECFVDDKNRVVERKKYMRFKTETRLKERVFTFSLEQGMLKICKLKCCDIEIVEES